LLSRRLLSRRRLHRLLLHALRATRSLLVLRRVRGWLLPKRQRLLRSPLLLLINSFLLLFTRPLLLISGSLLGCGLLVVGFWCWFRRWWLCGRV
jgi:hypothetical protein